MAVTTIISKRRSLVFQCITKKKFPNLSDIVNYVQSHVNDETEINKSTTEKDITAIRSDSFYPEILYSKKEKGYYVDGDFNKDNILERLMNAMDLFETLRKEEGSENFIQLEQQSSQNFELMSPLINAIKKRNVITFKHLKFWGNKESVREVHPYGLKEFKQRWYLIAKDTSDQNFKSFGLDRISDMQRLKSLFTKDEKFSLANYFKYSYGVSNSSETPIEAVLSFTPEQGNYIKSLPLHPTQTILVDNENELRISIQVWQSFELIQQLVSYGDYMKVIAPQSLISEVKGWFSEGLAVYKEP